MGGVNLMDTQECDLRHIAWLDCPGPTATGGPADRRGQGGATSNVRGGCMVELGSTSLTIVGVIAALGVAALLVAVVLRRQVLAAGEGTSSMREIARASRRVRPRT